MPPLIFPNPASAPADEPLAFGGDLSLSTLIQAYRLGIFPWFSPGETIQWWSPDPRAMFVVDEFHVPRRLARTIRSGLFSCTINTAFEAVMSGCAERDEGTWIGRKIIKAYSALHKAGHAHSVEVWQGTDLVGGIYGVQVGALFAGESMFSRVSDASKVAMVHLIGHLKKQGFLVLDAQVLNNHTESLGAVNVPRSSFLNLLAELRDRQLEFITA
jgi:leucyl/phenylalanyl-tRNA---protein transferase